MSTIRQKTKELEPRRYRGLMQVWHLAEDCFLQQFGEGTYCVWPEHYSLVAVMNTSCLDEAFTWSNECCGWEREEVRIYPDVEYLRSGQTNAPRCLIFDVFPRSTSVGDVLVTPDGIPYRVESGRYAKMD